MSYGYTWDNELRSKLVEAVDKSKKGDYVALNKIILEIQEPYVKLLSKIRELVV